MQVELEDHFIVIKKVMVTHSVYHWTQNSIKQSVEYRFGPICMYGAEYEEINSLVANSLDTDVLCAVCYVPTRNALYMIPAKYTCQVDGPENTLAT